MSGRIAIKLGQSFSHTDFFFHIFDDCFHAFDCCFNIVFDIFVILHI